MTTRFPLAPIVVSSLAWMLSGDLQAADPPFVPWSPESYAGCGGEVPAFPGAEGYGVEQTCGGRGGQILEVTSLEDDADAPPVGSLRAALEAHNAQNGPSIIVFRVGGTIVARDTFSIWRPNLTIAGQTAPGDGILLRTPATDGYEDGCTDPECYENGAEEDGRFTLLRIGASNVIVRHLRLRPGHDPSWVCDDDRDDDGVCWGDGAVTSSCLPAVNAGSTARYDNCPQAPNGPLGGTCTFGELPVTGSSCLVNSDCGLYQVCSTDQEDGDGDGIGDACDPNFDPLAPDPLEAPLYPEPAYVCHNGYGNMDALTVYHPDGSPRNVILDHLSLSWATDETVSFWATEGQGVSNVVLQYSIVSEGLTQGHKQAAYPANPQQPDGGLGILAGSSHDVSFHHNVIAQHTSRCPSTHMTGAHESVNNVLVNCSPSHANVREDEQTIALNLWHNLHLPGFRESVGPGTAWAPWTRAHLSSSPVFLHHAVHLVGNIGTDRLYASDPEEWILTDRPEVLEQVSVDPLSVPNIPVPPAAVGSYGNESGAFLAALLSDVGAYPTRRDAVDTRVVAQVMATHDDCMGASWPVGCDYDGVTDPADPAYGYSPTYGGLLHNQEQAGIGGFPVIASGSAPKDKDGDGMPNGWEGSNGLDNSDPTDALLDPDGDLYTNVEEYLNGTNPLVSEVDPDDVDYDHVPNAIDNCPDLANGGQADANDDGVGDRCSPACSDGLDNDGDGRIDWDPVTNADPLFLAGTGDPGCGDPSGVVEDPACNDGLDNDGARGTDFDGGTLALGAGNEDPDGPDPQCLGAPHRVTEKKQGCGLGPELALLLPALSRLRRRLRR